MLVAPDGGSSSGRLKLMRAPGAIGPSTSGRARSARISLPARKTRFQPARRSGRGAGVDQFALHDIAPVDQVDLGGGHVDPDVGARRRVVCRGIEVKHRAPGCRQAGLDRVAIGVAGAAEQHDEDDGDGNPGAPVPLGWRDNGRQAAARCRWADDEVGNGDGRRRCRVGWSAGCRRRRVELLEPAMVTADALDGAAGWADRRRIDGVTSAAVGTSDLHDERGMPHQMCLRADTRPLKLAYKQYVVHAHFKR